VCVCVCMVRVMCVSVRALRGMCLPKGPLHLFIGIKSTHPCIISCDTKLLDNVLQSIVLCGFCISRALYNQLNVLRLCVRVLQVL